MKVNSYKGDPLLFYPVRKNTGGINYVTEFEDDGTAKTRVGVSYVNLPSNSVEMPSGSMPTNKANINFNNETNEWTRNSFFTDTLFEVYYRSYIQDIYKKQKRIIKVTAYLPLQMLIKMRLNDLLIIGQDKFTINTMTTNLLTGKTDFELLNVAYR